MQNNLAIFISLLLFHSLLFRPHLLQTKGRRKNSLRCSPALNSIWPPRGILHPSWDCRNPAAGSFGTKHLFLLFSFPLSTSPPSFPKYLLSIYCVPGSELFALGFVVVVVVVVVFFFLTCIMWPRYARFSFTVCSENALTQTLHIWNSWYCRLSLSLRLYSEKELTKQYFRSWVRSWNCAKFRGRGCPNIQIPIQQTAWPIVLLPEF